MTEVKRVNYFTNQFLLEADFKDEQAYHLEMRRRHNRSLHTWGIVAGLDVSAVENLVSVSSGWAIDKDGQEIVVPADPPPDAIDVSGFPGKDVYITVAYYEVFDVSDKYSVEGVEDHVRTSERPQLAATAENPARDSLVIVLALISVDADGNAGTIHVSPRRRAGCVIAGPEDGVLDGSLSVAGNVGIGTTSPGDLLHLRQADDKTTITATNTRAQLRIHNNAYNDEVSYSSGGLSKILFNTGTDNGWNAWASIHAEATGLSDGQGDLVFSTHNSGNRLAERMRIDNSGNVGIGTTSPAGNLHVDDPTATTLVVGRSGQVPEIKAGGTNTDLRLSAVGPGGWLALRTNGTDRVHVGANGNVGIGTPDPTARLTVVDSNEDGNEAAVFLIRDAQDLPLGSNAADRLHIRTRGDPNGEAVLSIGGSLSQDASFLSAWKVVGGHGTTSNLVLQPSGGNVGIGTTGPRSLLHVNGSGENGWLAQFINTGTTDANGLLLSAGDDLNEYSLKVTDKTGTVTGLAVKANGNVGIGTPSPESELDIRGSSGPPGDANTLLKFRDTNSTRVGIQMGANSSGNYAWIEASQPTSFNADLVLNAQSGNVGIGTTNPSGVKLNVKSNASFDGFVVEANSNDAWLRLGHSGSLARIESTYLSTAGNQPLAISVGGSDRMYFNTDGNVGIGTPSPEVPLHVLKSAEGAAYKFETAPGRFIYGGSDANGTYVEQVGDSADQRRLRIQNSDGAGNYTQLFLDGANRRIYTNAGVNVGIGTPSPGAKLEVDGNVKISGNLEVAGDMIYRPLSNALAHLSRTDNPHSVTLAQLGAFAAADYEFNNRLVIQVSFSQADANGALRRTDLGFTPKFVWAIANLRARFGSQMYYGANASGFADLRGAALQGCNYPHVYRTSTAPFYRQDASLASGLCLAFFSDQTVTPNQEITIGASISAVAGTNLSVQFYRLGTGTGDLSLGTFNVSLYLYCLG